MYCKAEFASGALAYSPILAAFTWPDTFGQAPNVSGRTSTLLGGINDATAGATGAFRLGNVGETRVVVNLTSELWGSITNTFDASRISSIYKSITKVQPAAVQFLMIIKSWQPRVCTLDAWPYTDEEELALNVKVKPPYVSPSGLFLSVKFGLAPEKHPVALETLSLWTTALKDPITFGVLSECIWKILRSINASGLCANGQRRWLLCTKSYVRWRKWRWICRPNRMEWWSRRNQFFSVKKLINLQINKQNTGPLVSALNYH